MATPQSPLSRAAASQENDTKRTRAEKKFIEEEKKKEEHTLAIEEYKGELEKLKAPSHPSTPLA